MDCRILSTLLVFSFSYKILHMKITECLTCVKHHGRSKEGLPCMHIYKFIKGICACVFAHDAVEFLK